MSRFVIVIMLSIFSNSVFSSEDAIITGEQISVLRETGRPVQVSMNWKRLDGKFETVADFYLKADSNPITKRELAEKCSVKALLPFLVNQMPPSPLKVTVTVRSISEGVGSPSRESITSFSVMDKDQLCYYGFFDVGGK